MEVATRRSHSSKPHVSHDLAQHHLVNGRKRVTKQRRKHRRKSQQPQIFGNIALCKILHGKSPRKSKKGLAFHPQGVYNHHSEIIRKNQDMIAFFQTTQQ
jgi:hypothetical protein